RAVELVGIGNLGDTTHRHLRRQSKLAPTRLIGQLMQGKLAKRFGVPRLASQPGTGAIRHLERLKERGILCFGRSKFDVSDKFHSLKYRDICNKSHPKKLLAFQANLGATVWAQGSGPLNWAALPTQSQGAQRPFFPHRLNAGVSRKETDATHTLAS